MQVKIGQLCPHCSKGRMRPHLFVSGAAGDFHIQIHHVYCDSCHLVQHSGYEGMSRIEVHRILAKELDVKECAIRRGHPHSGNCPDHPQDTPLRVKFMQSDSRASLVCPVCLRHLNK
jgi:hypothetical protein